MEYYTIRELKEYARQNGIIISGLTLKSDILNAIKQPVIKPISTVIQVNDKNMEKLQIIARGDEYWREKIETESENYNKYLEEKDYKLLQNYPNIKRYTLFYDGPINMGLRNGKLSYRSFEIIKEIYDALNKAEPTKRQEILFRGVRPTPNFPINTYKTGDIITEKGIMSKSLSIEDALRFTDGQCCLMVILYPPGSKLLGLSSVSEFPEESEYISYPGEQFQVQEVIQYQIGRFNLQTLIVTYIGNIYFDINEIAAQVDLSIDRRYLEFKRCLKQFINIDHQVTIYDSLYIVDANMIIIVNNDDNFITFNLETGVTDEHELNDYESRIYTLYAMNLMNNLYVFKYQQHMELKNIQALIKNNPTAYKRVICV